MTKTDYFRIAFCTFLLSFWMAPMLWAYFLHGTETQSLAINFSLCLAALGVLLSIVYTFITNKLDEIELEKQLNEQIPPYSTTIRLPIG